MKVVTANGEGITAAGTPNPACTGMTYPEDATENARSLGIVLTYGKFRMIDLGDLTSRKELELVCPENRLGTVDVYLSTHHGLAASNAKEIVQALNPRVAIMNNGAKKGGSPQAWQNIKTSPGLEDLWQLHYCDCRKVREQLAGNSHCEPRREVRRQVAEAFGHARRIV